jgi:subtilisin family serine protease
MNFLFSFIFYLAAILVNVSADQLRGAFIIELAKDSSINTFKQAAAFVKYDVRVTFDNPEFFLGLSIQITDLNDLEKTKAQLQAIPGVVAVSEVIQYEVTPEAVTDLSPPSVSPNSTQSLKRRSRVWGRQAASGDLSFTLQMGGIDKVHAEGLKGKGIKIGFIDTAVDYKHPALGGSMGPGKKIAGGYSFITDEGQTIESPDPYSGCAEAYHGTHVAGKIAHFLQPSLASY